VRPACWFAAPISFVPLAHGGTAGLLVELGLVFVVLAVLAAAWRAGRRERAEQQEKVPDQDRGKGESG
jgi:hypothetical protein